MSERDSWPQEPLTRAPSSRRSYRRLMQLPAWLLVDEHGDIVGSVAAENAHEARRLFKAASPAHGFSRGRWVRKATDAT